MYYKLVSLLLTAIIICSGNLQAHAADSECPDSVATDYSFKPAKLIAPLALTAAGAVGISTLGGFKHYVNRQIGRWGGSHNVQIDNYLRFAPAAVYVGLGVCGVKSRNNLRDRVMAGATAYIFMGAIVAGTKACVQERRPDGSGFNSFPSGHVATAFTGAELMRIEYGNGIGAAGYAIAAGVGVLRIYNNRHWYNDVLAGAGIGILCARLGYWLLPLERKLFKFRARDAVVMPYYSSANRDFGLSFAASF